MAAARVLLALALAAGTPADAFFGYYGGYGGAFRRNVVNVVRENARACMPNAASNPP